MCVHILSDIKIASSILLIFFTCAAVSLACMSVYHVHVWYTRNLEEGVRYGAGVTVDCKLGVFMVGTNLWHVGEAASNLNFWVISVDLIDQYSLTSHFSCPVHSIEKFCTSEISSCVLESRTQFIYFQYLLSVAFWKFKNVHWLSCSISLSANKLSKYIKGYILFFRLTVVVLPTFNIFHFLLGFLRFLLT